MLAQAGPDFGVFSINVLTVLLPAVLVVGALYLVVSLTMRARASSRAERSQAGAENPVFETLYVLALAVLVAAFVGFAIEVFYPAPESPQSTTLPGEISSTSGEDAPPSAEGPGESQTRVEVYQRELADHNQVASVVAIVAAVAILVAGLTPGIGLLPVIGEGVTLGGVLTLLYGMTLAIQAPSDLLGFFVVAVGLIVLLATLYLKFQRPSRTVTRDDRSAGSREVPGDQR